jgi:cathepsin L
MGLAFGYIEANGIEDESAYPYVGQDGTCSFKAEDVSAKISGYNAVPKNDAD